MAYLPLRYTGSPSDRNDGNPGTPCRVFFVYIASFVFIIHAVLVISPVFTRSQWERSAAGYFFAPENASALRFVPWRC